MFEKVFVLFPLRDAVSRARRDRLELRSVCEPDVLALPPEFEWFPLFRSLLIEDEEPAAEPSSLL